MKSVNALLEYMKQHDMDAFFLAKNRTSATSVDTPEMIPISSSPKIISIS